MRDWRRSWAVDAGCSTEVLGFCVVTNANRREKAACA
jgi:hypothetical protein